METFKDFIKLYGHINAELKQGTTYTLEIINQFDTKQFAGEKFIYLSEVNDFGGTSNFLGFAFLVMAGIVVLIMIVFIILYFVRIRGKDLYSTENLEW